MNRIKILDAVTINQIAAGEVVDRPAAVVKELVENSIDAGARRIDIELQNGGRALIRVTDDGCGMNRSDAILSVRRHTTSKLSTAADLLSIKTLGFRGEALSSIAAVSKFILQTRLEGSELGTKLTVDGGRIRDVQEVGCKIGTTVLVEDIFFNTPARLKFLKAAPSEVSRAHDFIMKLAISHPEISFRFINGNRISLETSGDGNIIEVLNVIYGDEVSKSLVPLEYVENDIKLSGFITKPNILKSYRSWQTFIINDRVIENRTILKAIDEAYKSLIPKVGFPLAIIRITLPPDDIDINVHPQKLEVKFEDDGQIFKIVYRAVHEAIEENKAGKNQNLKQIAVAPDRARYELPKFVENSSLKVSKRKNTRVPRIKENFDFEEIVTNLKSTDNISVSLKTTPLEKMNESSLEKPLRVELEPIGQIARCYIVAQGEEDLYLIDQHAAHERILFDKLSSYTENIPAQGLLIHRILKFDENESKLIEENISLFAKLGFTLELSGINEFRLTEMPIDAIEADAEDLLRAIVSEIFEGLENARDIARNIRQACLSMTACKAAIKSGQELNASQMQVILKDLAQTAHPHTCPHGRPTIIKFTRNALAKMFKRT